jgi:hypothetical protein
MRIANCTNAERLLSIKFLETYDGEKAVAVQNSSATSELKVSTFIL